MVKGSLVGIMKALPATRQNKRKAKRVVEGEDISVKNDGMRNEEKVE